MEVRLTKTYTKYPEYRHDGTDRVVIPFRQKLRHGIDFIFKVDGNEKDGNDDQRRSGHPFISGYSKSEGKARS